jgi:sulfide:quinone oxidoreductase
LSSPATEDRWSPHHLSIVCLMDTGNGAAMVYRGRTRNVVIRLPIVGHWMKLGWCRYARAVKLGRIPRVPGL